jgi:hypothetical protein
MILGEAGKILQTLRGHRMELNGGHLNRPRHYVPAPIAKGSKV